MFFIGSHFMKSIVFTIIFLTGSVLLAEVPNFKSITCLDAGSAMKSPVFFDVGVQDATSPNGIRFELGNIISGADLGSPGQTLKDATGMGIITALDTNGTSLSLKGSFGTSAIIDLQTGAGTVTGAIKYDPPSGTPVDIVRIKQYPINCKIAQ
jgi:hypothetical protein